MSYEILLQWLYGIAFLSVAWRWVRAGLFRQYPFFLAYLLIGGPACTVMQPHNPDWLATWYVPITICTLALRAISAGESIHNQSKHPWDRLLVAGATCIAISWAIAEWEYRGIGQFRPWIDIRNHAQIALWLAFGLASLILWRFDPERRQFDRSHSRILFCLLSIHAGIAMWSTVRTRFGAAWDGAFSASLIAGVMCCAAWHIAISKRTRAWRSELPRLDRPLLLL